VRPEARARARARARAGKLEVVDSKGEMTKVSIEEKRPIQAKAINQITSRPNHTQIHTHLKLTFVSC
jgi:adenylate kinase